MDTRNFYPVIQGHDLLKFSFTNRIVGEWNRLLSDIRQASFVVDFKSKVFKFLAHF